MIRRIFSSFAAVAVLLLMMIACALIVTSNIVCAVSRYYPYLNWDRNYLNCGEQHGMKYYIVRDSINVELYDDSKCVLSADIVDVETRSRRSPFKRHEGPVVIKTSTVYFLYDFDAEQMYVDTNNYFNDEYSKGKWHPLYYRPSWADGGRFELAGDIAYYIIYGEGFYRSEDQFGYIDN